MNASLVVTICMHLVFQGGLFYWTLSSLAKAKPSWFTLKSLWKEYSVGDSGLDIPVSVLVYSIVLVLCMVWARYRLNRLVRMFQVPRTDALALKAPRTSIYVLTSVYHILLLGKAVVVAILSDEEPWPVDRYHSGLVCIYTGLVVAFVVTQFQQHVCMRAIDSLAKKKAMEVRASSLYQPLVADSEEHKDDGGEEEVRHATILGLLGFAAPDTLLLTVAFLAGSLAALGQALIPYYTGKIIDYASIDPDRALFKYTIVKLLLVAFLCAIFTGIRGGLFTYAMTRMNVRLRMRLFSSLLRQDCGFFDRNRIGDITSRLSADTTTVSDQICLNLNVMMRSITQAAMVLVFMFKSSWRLSVVTFVMVPIVIIVCKVYGAYYRRMSKTVQARLAEANSVADESLSSISIVKSHAAEGSTESAYETKLREFYFIQVKQALAYSLYMINNTFLTAAVIAGVLFYGGTLVLNDAMSAGSLVSFMLYQQSLSASFQSLGDVFSALSAAVGAADKVIELINKSPAFVESGTEKPDRDLVGSIEFRNVSFSYPARPGITILENFSLSIRPGEVVALVGPSGGGKSSIVKLLERQYLPSNGAVLIDGRDIGSYDKKWLRQRVALVGQEPVLFARSIKRNIIYGMETNDGLPEEQVPDDEEIELASKLANAHEFISLLPEQYETECGERGVQLSGGQKQRLAIARALVRKPSILLLDEATSALDADSEHVVQEALDRTMVGRTVLVIAHRLSTIQNADRICVVQKGAVVEMGTHEELLERQGIYAKLVRRQLARSESSASLLGMTPSASSAKLA
ncbi:hypothetical protein M9434_006345 [Picochlorum sp. BPE23]|nr:hypothetical protein M9434_006345 [Picochlorum sp. BPE23]